MTIHFLGPVGTFSEAAADGFRKLFKLAGDLSPCSSIAAVVAATEQSGSLGVVPYYNLIDGLVQESLDRVLMAGLVLHGGLQLPIKMAIGGPDGVDENAPVYSHPKALAQCSDYLDQHHAQRKRMPVSSTAEGTQYAAEKNALALAAPGAFISRGLPMLSDDTANRYFGRRNYTEFLLIGTTSHKNQGAPTDEPRCILACSPQTDRPGLLADILSVLSLLNMNLARLHSRPAIAAAPTQLDPQVFYLEIAGTVSEENLSLCTQMLSTTLGGDKGSRVVVRMGKYALLPVSDSQN